jgi:hypothetical protein
MPPDGAVLVLVHLELLADGQITLTLMEILKLKQRVGVTLVEAAAMKVNIVNVVHSIDIGLDLAHNIEQHSIGLELEILIHLRLMVLGLTVGVSGHTPHMAHGAPVMLQELKKIIPALMWQAIFILQTEDILSLGVF